MADPVNIDIKVPLRGNGWLQVQVHITDLDDIAPEDQEFVLSVLDRVRGFTADLHRAGLLDTPVQVLPSGNRPQWQWAPLGGALSAPAEARFDVARLLGTGGPGDGFEVLDSWLDAAQVSKLAGQYPPGVLFYRDSERETGR